MENTEFELVIDHESELAEFTSPDGEVSTIGDAYQPLVLDWKGKVYVVLPAVPADTGEELEYPSLEPGEVHTLILSMQAVNITNGVVEEDDDDDERFEPSEPYDNSGNSNETPIN
jgi:hypothetical protein